MRAQVDKLAALIEKPAPGKQAGYQTEHNELDQRPRLAPPVESVQDEKPHGKKKRAKVVQATAVLVLVEGVGIDDPAEGQQHEPGDELRALPAESVESAQHEHRHRQEEALPG